MKIAFLILFIVGTSLSELMSLNAQPLLSMNQQRKRGAVKKTTSPPAGITIANAELRSEPWPKGKVLIVLPKGVRVRALASVTVNTLELYTIWIKVKVLQWPGSRPPNAPDLGWLQVSLVRVEEPGETPQAQTDTRDLKVQPTTEPINQWPTGTKRFALVIGVDEYQDRQISKLVGASNDAKALADALVRYAGFPRNQVILLASDQPVDRQPTRSNIMRKLSDIRQAAPKDGLLLISFSGHGFERDGHAYLLPMDTQASEDVALLEESAINVETLRERIRQTGVGQVVIILDACRNNPSSGRGNASTPLTNTYIRGFNFDIHNRDITAFATLYSTGVGQVAYEDKDRKQGYFTLTMVEGLKGSAANERGEVTLASLVEFVQETVPKRTAIDIGNRQKPFAVIEGYKASQLVISVPSQNPKTNADSSVEPFPSVIFPPPLENNDDKEPDIEHIETGKSKEGVIAEKQQREYKFEGIANVALRFILQKEHGPTYNAEIYDSRGRKLKSTAVFTIRGQEMVFTPPTDGHYILRLTGRSGYGKYTVRFDRL